jgi:hypothetical protein
MTKEVKQLIITGALIVILIITVMSNLKKKPKIVNPPAAPSAAGIPAAPVAALAPSPALSTDENIKNLQNLRAGLPWARDPFSESANKNSQTDELKLQGISFGKDKSGYAFINNEIVKKGDTIGDYEVIEIEKARVFLKKESQSFYLAFPEEE